jgi:hypothetical protein
VNRDELQMPSASGVRLAGDDYQHAYTWLMALRCLIRGSDVSKVEFEVRDAGNVDDVVVHHDGGRSVYHQIKFVVDQRLMLTAEWFTTPSRTGGASPLQRFYASYLGLGGPDDPPKMVLYTNRASDPSDPLMRYIGGLDGRLVPRAPAAATRSGVADELAAWAQHLKIEEAELLAMLANLHIRAGEQSLRDLEERCQDTMGMLGLKSDDASLLAGVGALRRLIRVGRVELDASQVRELVRTLDLPVEPPRASLLIQCLSPDPWPEQATASVDWVPLFDGGEARARRQLHDPTGWEGRLRPELTTAVDNVSAQGFRRVMVNGTYRLSVAMLAGVLMPRVAGFEVARRQSADAEWWSEGAATPVEFVAVEHDLGEGAEVAVAISVAATIDEDVKQFCVEQLPDVGRVISFTPPSGAGWQAIADDAAARGMATALIAGIRAAGRGVSVVHLFQAAPSGLSLLLGHAWNRMPEVQLYDDLNNADGYTPTFRIAA